MEKYEKIKLLGFGGFGETWLMKNKNTEELVAMKFIPRGREIDKKVEREIINLRSLRHPNIIGFKEVVLTPTHLGIVMEYAPGGELFYLIINNGRLSEDKARYFFQQLISGVSYFHSMHVSHRDLKPQNIVLDGSKDPQLKICDFGLSKSSLLHSSPKSTVGTPIFIAPEVYSGRKYDGKLADVWSCAVTLYVMLVGAYPRGDARLNNVHIPKSCRTLLSRMFVADPAKRITIKDIKNHPWFLEKLPSELTEAAQAKIYNEGSPTNSLQSVEDIMKIVNAAKVPPPVSPHIKQIFPEGEEEDGDTKEEDEEDVTVFAFLLFCCGLCCPKKKTFV